MDDMKNTHAMSLASGRRSTRIITRLIDTLRNGMASDIVSYPSTGMAVANRATRRAAVSDIVGGVSDRETLAAA